MLLGKHVAMTSPGEAMLWHENAGHRTDPGENMRVIRAHAPFTDRSSLSPIDLQETDDGFVIYIHVASNSGDKLLLTVRGQMVTVRNLDRLAATSRASQEDWYGGSSFSCLLPDSADCNTARMLREDGRITITIDKY